MEPHARIILWSAAKHSGKSTGALKVAWQTRARGFTVAGLLSPSVYVNGKLTGFDALDLRSGKRAHLSECDGGGSGPAGFRWLSEGMELAERALDATKTASAELVIVDEFGPLEMVGRGWRKYIDSLITSNDTLILLVVRESLVDDVEELYSAVPSLRLSATDPKSIDRVIEMIEKRRKRSVRIV